MIQAFARYNQWMNDNLVRACDQLSDQARRQDLGAFFKSIHGTWNHILLADSFWLRRMSGDDDKYQLIDATGRPLRISGLDDELYTDWDEFKRVRQDYDRLINEFVAGCTPEDLQRTVTYSRSDGAAQGHPLWWAVQHMFNHQTHHRGQLTTLIFQQGVDPGVTDLVAMLRMGFSQ